MKFKFFYVVILFIFTTLTLISCGSNQNALNGVWIGYVSEGSVFTDDGNIVFSISFFDDTCFLSAILKEGYVYETVKGNVSFEKDTCTIDFGNSSYIFSNQYELKLKKGLLTVKNSKIELCFKKDDKMIADSSLNGIWIAENMPPLNFKITKPLSDLTFAFIDNNNVYVEQNGLGGCGNYNNETKSFTNNIFYYGTYELINNELSVSFFVYLDGIRYDYQEEPVIFKRK